MNPYHSWLIRMRKWCEHEGCLTKLERATTVVNRNGKDLVMCDWHSRTYRPIESGLKLRAELER